MKVTVQQVAEGEDEVIIQYREMTPEIEQLITFIRKEKSRLLGWIGKEQVLMNPRDILYIESVDGKSFAYTSGEVYRLEETLSETEALLEKEGFFRCSKSMIINVNRLEHLKSLPCNRIDARMENGEHVVISRKYAPALRKLLRGEGSDDEPK